MGRPADTVLSVSTSVSPANILISLSAKRGTPAEHLVIPQYRYGRRDIVLLEINQVSPERRSSFLTAVTSVFSVPFDFPPRAPKNAPRDSFKLYRRILKKSAVKPPPNPEPAPLLRIIAGAGSVGLCGMRRISRPCQTP
jgi:hypothetical protein